MILDRLLLAWLRHGLGSVKLLLIASTLASAAYAQSASDPVHMDAALQQAHSEGRPLLLILNQPDCDHCAKRAQYLHSEPRLTQAFVFLEGIYPGPFTSGSIDEEALLDLRMAVLSDAFAAETKFDHHDIVIADSRGTAFDWSRIDESRDVDRVLDRLAVRPSAGSLSAALTRKQVLTRAKELAKAARLGCDAFHQALITDEDPTAILMALRHLKKGETKDDEKLWQRLLAHPRAHVQMAAFHQLSQRKNRGLEIISRYVLEHMSRRLWLVQNASAFGRVPARMGYEGILDSRISQAFGELAISSKAYECAGAVACLFRVYHDTKEFAAIDQYLLALAKKQPGLESAVVIANAMDLSGFFYEVDAGLSEEERINRKLSVDSFTVSYGEERKFLAENELRSGKTRQQLKMLFLLLTRWKCPVDEPDWERPEQVADAMLAVRAWIQQKQDESEKQKDSSGRLQYARVKPPGV